MDLWYIMDCHNGMYQILWHVEPKRRWSTFDYLIGSPYLIPEIREFIVSGRPIGLAADHAYLRFEVKDGCARDVYVKESGLSKYQFIRETIDVYSCAVYNEMLDLDPFAPLDEVTQGLSKWLHKAATNAFPHTMANAPKLGRVIQYSRCDEECRDTRW